MSDIIPIKRHVTVLQQGEFDLLITGAGIFGACAAWEAAFRGYRVALIDRSALLQIAPHLDHPLPIAIPT